MRAALRASATACNIDTMARASQAVEMAVRVTVGHEVVSTHRLCHEEVVIQTKEEGAGKESLERARNRQTERTCDATGSDISIGNLAEIGIRTKRQTRELISIITCKSRI